jgi:hypothetical protein
MPRQVETVRADIRSQIALRQPARPLAEGEARLQVEGFALTANNVTYAATGEVIGYWKFFPATGASAGIVPVWGFARVRESRSPHLAEGAVLYGFLPMAETVVITPEPRGKAGIVDATPHRAALPPVYNFYAFAPEADDHARARRAIFHPLLATSWLIADFLRENGFFGARQVVVGSASGKTAIGLCRFLAGDGPQTIGLTSDANRAFVTGLGLCDDVVTYDEVSERLASVPSVFVDMAGNATVRLAVHGQLGEQLKHSMAVGTSHWDQFQPALDLPGPKPRFFFAPAQIEKRRADWGPGVVEAKIDAAWQEVAAESASWLTIALDDGLDAAMQVYRDIADGLSDPSKGHYIRLS